MDLKITKSNQSVSALLHSLKQISSYFDKSTQSGNTFHSAIKNTLNYAKAVENQIPHFENNDILNDVRHITECFDNIINQANSLKNAFHQISITNTSFSNNETAHSTTVRDMFIRYLQRWQSQGLYFEKDNGVVGIEEVIYLLHINKHLEICDLNDYLYFLESANYLFIIRREYPPYAEEEFMVSAYELLEHKDNLDSLMAFKHGVAIEKYLDWIDQITNPRCRSIKKDGTPCLTLLSIKQPATPNEFKSPDHTCCHIHRENWPESLYLPASHINSP